MGYLEPERDYESAYDPIVKLFQHEAEAEARRLKHIERFLDTLRPADAQLDLFTHYERWWFDIGPHQKRPRE